MTPTMTTNKSTTIFCCRISVLTHTCYHSKLVLRAVKSSLLCKFRIIFRWLMFNNNTLVDTRINICCNIESWRDMYSWSFRENNTEWTIAKDALLLLHMNIEWWSIDELLWSSVRHVYNHVVLTSLLTNLMTELMYLRANGSCLCRRTF